MSFLNLTHNRLLMLLMIGLSFLAACDPPVVSTHSSYRYTDNGDGTVTDNRSGLIWLKNANCFGYQDWKKAMQSAANLASGQCGLRDGSK